MHPRWSLETLRYGAPKLENFATVASDASTSNVAMLASLAEARIDWPALDRLRERWRGKLIVKGVLRPQDAARIAAAGVDAIVVSNHGGRQLGSVATSIDMLPAVRQAVGNTVAVLLDSGIRSGEDIVKALALGADFVLVGRAFLYGAAALGPERGAAQVIDMLRSDLDATLAQLGCNTIADLSAEVLRNAGDAKSIAAYATA